MQREESDCEAFNASVSQQNEVRPPKNWVYQSDQGGSGQLLLVIKWYLSRSLSEFISVQVFQAAAEVESWWGGIHRVVFVPAGGLDLWPASWPELIWSTWSSDQWGPAGRRGCCGFNNRGLTVGQLCRDDRFVCLWKWNSCCFWKSAL